MNYKNFLTGSSFLGYAYCHLILNDDDEPYNFEFLEVNDAFGKITGIGKSELVGNTARNAIPGIEKSEFDWFGTYGEIALKGGEKELEQFIEHEQKWVKVHISSTEKLFFTITFVDITESKMQHSELETFFSVALNLLCIADLNGYFIKTNEGWSELLGYSTEELNGKKFLDFVHPDDIQETLNVMSCLKEGKQIHNFINRYRTRDDTYRYIEWRSRLEGDRVYAAARDVTERKQNEDTLIQERELLRAVIENSPDSIYVKDTKTRKMIANSTDCYYSGVEDEQELLGKTDYDLFPEDVARSFFEDDQKVLNRGVEIRNREEKITGPKGEDIWLLTTKIPLRDENNDITGLLGIGRDITKRREAEIETQKFVERIKQLGNHLPGFIYQFLLRPDGTSCFPYASNGIEDIYGVSPPDVKSDASAAFKVLHPDDIQYVRESIHKSADQMSHWKETYRVNLPTDKTIWVEGSATPQKMDDGSILWHGYIHDITQQKEAELELKKLSIAVEQSPTSVIITNPDGVIEYVNSTFIELTGYSSNEAVGKKPSILNSGHQADDFYKKLWDTITSGKTWTGDLLNKKKNGELYWESANITPVFDDHGQITHYLGVKEDITERKKVEQELFSSKRKIEESEEKYRAIFEKSLVAIIIADDEGNYISANDAACDLLGYSADEIEHMSVKDIKTKESGSAGKKYSEYIKKGEDSGEFEFITKSGAHKIAYYKAARVRENFNISMLIDVTEQIEAEKKLRAAKKQAERANEAKSQFLAKMSHELRTPLNGVIGFTDILSGTSLTPVQKEYVNSANISGRNLLKIINDVLDLSKIEADMLELDPVKTDVYKLLQNSMDVVKLSAASKNLELLLDLAPELPRHIYVDPVRLTQILSNLLSNAIKFTEYGEIELKVEYNSVIEGSGNILFSVRDTGIGITPDQKQKLFKAFSQGDGSTTREYGGTGLGLVISQRIAEKMGGQIDFESSPGKGSRFFFELFVDTEDDVPKLEFDVAQKRFLIADDHDGSRAILSSMLVRKGMEVVECKNGREVIKCLESDPEGFDVLICDNGMPHMSGRETVRMVREKVGITPDQLRVVLLFTSSDEIAERTDCGESKNVCCVDKPIKLQELFLCLNGKDVTVEAPMGAEPAIDTERRTKGSTKILIAEDVPMNLQLISALLKSNLPQANLLKAENGKRALELYRSGEPDLVLMDVQMPLMDGMEATREIRQLERQKGGHTPIVALTAAAMKEDVQKCLDAGMDDVITKPIEPNKLKKVLAEYLEKKKVF